MGCCCPISHNLGDCIAEAKAVFEGLRLAREMSSSCIVVESDSLLVIQALNGKAYGFSDFHLVVEDFLSLVPHFTSICWSFVKRSVTN